MHIVPRLFLFLFPAATAAAIDLTPNRLPPATLGKPYQGGPLVAYGGGPCPRNSISMRVVAGELPEGLTLTPSGNFFGAAQSPGTYQFVVRAENACSWADREFTLEVGGAPFLQVNPSALEFRVSQGQPLEGSVTLRVCSNPQGVAYTLEPSGAAWIEARARGGATPPPGSGLQADLIDVFIDSARLPVGTHRALLRLSAWRAVESTVVPVTIHVAPAPVSPAQAPPRWHDSGPAAEPIVLQAAPPRAGDGPNAHPDQGFPDHGTAGKTGVHATPPRASSTQATGRATAPAQSKGVKPVARPVPGKTAPAGRMSRAGSLKARPRPPVATLKPDHAKPSPVAGKPAPDPHASGGTPPKGGPPKHTAQAAGDPKGHAGEAGHSKPSVHGPASPQPARSGHGAGSENGGDHKTHAQPAASGSHAEPQKGAAAKETPAPAKTGHD